jgi:hypothetical protein
MTRLRSPRTALSHLRRSLHAIPLHQLRVSYRPALARSTIVLTLCPIFLSLVETTARYGATRLGALAASHLITFCEKDAPTVFAFASNDHRAASLLERPHQDLAGLENGLSPSYIITCSGRSLLMRSTAFSKSKNRSRVRDPRTERSSNAFGLCIRGPSRYVAFLCCRWPSTISGLTPSSAFFP